MTVGACLSVTKGQREGPRVQLILVTKWVFIFSKKCSCVHETTQDIFQVSLQDGDFLGKASAPKSQPVC